MRWFGHIAQIIEDKIAKHTSKNEWVERKKNTKKVLIGSVDETSKKKKREMFKEQKAV